jgi:hypothetical protein
MKVTPPTPALVQSTISTTQIPVFVKELNVMSMIVAQKECALPTKFVSNVTLQ